MAGIFQSGDYCGCHPRGISWHHWSGPWTMDSICVIGRQTNNCTFTVLRPYNFTNIDHIWKWMQIIVHDLKIWLIFIYEFWMLVYHLCFCIKNYIISCYRCVRMLELERILLMVSCALGAGKCWWIITRACRPKRRVSHRLLCLLRLVSCGNCCF